MAIFEIQNDSRMKKILITLFTMIVYCSFAQHIKFYQSNSIKFLKGANDTLRFPFTGGVNTPLFSNFDFNNDGKLDLFVFDRATSKVLCFVYTNAGFVHAPQYELAFPYMESFALAGDYNADNKPDIFTTVVDDLRFAIDSNAILYGPGLRILKNTSSGANFSLKQVNPQVKDTGRSGMGFNPPIPINIQPRNVATSSVDNMAIGDIDNDGDDDIVNFEGQLLSPQFLENYKVNKFNIQYPADSTRFIFRDECWGDMQYAASSGVNKFNLHLRRDQLANCSYRIYGKQQKHAGSTMAMLDYNHDGYKDIVYGDVGFNNLILLLNGRGINSQGRDSIIAQDSMFPSNSIRANFVLFPAPYFVDINGDGNKDLLVSTNYTVGTPNTNNVWTYLNTGTTAKPVFNYESRSFFMYNNTIDFGSRTVPVVVDVDGDAKKDLLIATSGNYEQTQNSKDQLVYYRNIGSNAKPVYTLVDSNFLRLTADTPILEMHPTTGDLNGDGKYDLVIGNTNGKLEYYLNTSSGNVSSFKMQTRNLGNIDVGNNSAPQLFDLNRDGVLDLLVGAKNGTISYFKNIGTRTNPQFSEQPTIDTLGRINTCYGYVSTAGFDILLQDGYATPHACELDGDTNTIEMLVGSSVGEIYLYTHVSDTLGKVFKRTDTLFAINDKGRARNVRFGMRSVPVVASLDEDNRADVLIGNLGGGLNFYASVAAPVDTTTTDTNSVDELNKKQFIQVYPNPTNGDITFSTSNMRANMNYEVVNTIGQLMLNGEVNYYNASHTIDVSNLSSGMYFLRLQNETQQFYARFLISK